MERWVAVAGGSGPRSGLGGPSGWRLLLGSSLSMGAWRLQPNQAPGVGFYAPQSPSSNEQWAGPRHTWPHPAGNGQEQSRSNPCPLALPSLHHDGVPRDALSACTMIMVG